MFVLDMANNHQGDVEHGLRIVREFAGVAKANNARAAIKFQFRQLDSIVHPNHRQNSDNKHIPRFLSTQLTRREFERLVAEVHAQGLTAVATPFDEESVDLLDEIGIDVAKVASCSANDWPLLEKIAEFNRPVIVSTGGLSLDDIGDIVSFFDHRRVHFALMHCVAIYPTPNENLELNQLEVIKRRYPHVTVGFSTHERPDEMSSVQIAVAKGAKILERHIGITAEGKELNAYSSTPDQINRWMKAAFEAKRICGSAERQPTIPEERASLDSLKRGVYARRAIKPGSVIGRDDIYFAMPWVENQLPSGRWEDGIVAKQALLKDGPLLLDAIVVPRDANRDTLLQAIHSIKAMLNESRIALPVDFQLEFSHHHGIESFNSVGATIINCISREYCKKLIIQLPGQYHPNHYHKRKEETFQVLSGQMEANIEGRRTTLYPGDILVVPRGVWHDFWTDTGLVFEEISTTHFDDDSFYEDKRINSMERQRRKTVVSQWGRYQL
jgi:N-acetylneuraminate synthase